MPAPLAAYWMLDVEGSLCHSAIVLILSVVCVAASVWFIGMTKNMKQILLDAVFSKLHIDK